MKRLLTLIAAVAATLMLVACSVPTGIPSASGSTVPDQIELCGTLGHKFCAVPWDPIHGSGQPVPFTIKGATVYGLDQGDPATLVADAQAAGLNTIELVNFDNIGGTADNLADVENSATWTQIDKIIQAAANAHLHVILNLSEFNQAMLNAGYKYDNGPDSYAWDVKFDQYANFISTRPSPNNPAWTYSNDPTIAMVELWGEPPTPLNDNGTVNTSAPWGGSSAEMQQYFSNSLSDIRTQFCCTIESSGGLSHLNAPNSDGVPYQAIYSNSQNQVCDMEINSYPDRDTSLPLVTNYCNSLSLHPWFLSAWSSCYKMNQGTPGPGNWDNGDWQNGETPQSPNTINPDPYNSADNDMQGHAQDMYNESNAVTPPSGEGVASYASVGTDFWDLGPSGTYGTCQLGTQFPATWAVIQAAS